jgi:hypothetical protein
VAPVAPLTAHPAYSGSADPSVAELAARQPVSIAGRLPTRYSPTRVNLEKALNWLARFVRKDLAK